ncbi:iron dicitrate transporter FecR [Bacteroidia bacterium]|nr:iron dicitrate transporter FecR [Bacteroidia bacterium]GHU73689.1 iron dicitrate transporter FecR [Bacteroidia bacterium]
MEKKNIQEQGINRFLDDLYTPEDAETIFSNLQQEAGYENVFQECMDKTWANLEDYPETSYMEKQKYKEEAAALLQKINRKKIRHPYWKQAISIAASLLILISLTIGWFKTNQATPAEVLYSDVTTSYGETKIVTLPDGTTVTLNACSHISYLNQFENNERRVKLEGEAYFQVTRNEKQLFIIITNQFDVNVLGTEFNIKAYQNDEIYAVNVNSGKVQVEMPEATIRLVAEEHLAIDLLNDSYSKYKENQPVAGWRKGYLHFNKAPIRDVANELERIYHCSIEFAPDQVFDNLISGEHANPNLESVLKSIEYTSGIHFKQEKDKIRFYK